MCRAQEPTELLLDPGTILGASGVEFENGQCPRHRVVVARHRKGKRRIVAGQMPDQTSLIIDRPGPANRFTKHRHDAEPLLVLDVSRCIHGGENELRWSVMPIVEDELQPLSLVAYELMTAQKQTDAVGLQPVTKSRLRYPRPPLDIDCQVVKFHEQVVVEFGRISPDDPTEQQAAKPRRIIDRQLDPADCHPSGGSDGPGVIDLQFGKNHRITLAVLFGTRDTKRRVPRRNPSSDLYGLCEAGTMSRIALVTGATRRSGIAASVVERLLADGLRVMATGWSQHDAEMPWGVDAHGGAQLHEQMRADGQQREDQLAYVEADLGDPATPHQLVDTTIDRFGAIDVVVAVHARSSHDPLARVTAEDLDRCWAVNTRSSILLAQALGARFKPEREHGRVVLFTSGQHIEPMGQEIAYAVSKGAIEQATSSVADELIDHNITVNCINPGPVDTGWATGDTHAAVARKFPSGRWGQPADTAKLVSFLVSEEAGWITGQTINSEGGFRRSR